MAIGRGDRLYAFDHLGLPLNLQPSRAMTIRIAQTVDADYVIFGSYTADQNQQLTATAEILDVPALRLGPEIWKSATYSSAGLARPARLESDAATRSAVRGGGADVSGGGRQPARRCIYGIHSGTRRRSAGRAIQHLREAAGSIRNLRRVAALGRRLLSNQDFRPGGGDPGTISRRTIRTRWKRSFTVGWRFSTPAITRSGRRVCVCEHAPGAAGGGEQRGGGGEPAQARTRRRCSARR